MSSILNALNKSEAERQRAQPPGWNSPMQFGQKPPPRRRRWWLLVLALAVIGVLAAVYFWPSGSSQEGSEGPAEASAPASAPAGERQGHPDQAVAGDVPDRATGQPSRTAEADAADLAFAHAQRAERLERLRAAAPSIEQLQAMSRERRAAQAEIRRRNAEAIAGGAGDTDAEPVDDEIELDEALIDSLLAGEDVDEETLKELIEAAADLTQEPTAADTAAPGTPATAGPASAPARPAQAAVPAAQAPASRVVATAPQAPEHAAAAGAVDLPRVNELAFAPRNALPAMDLTMHLYSDDPARRMVLLNGARAGDGDELDNGLRILAIRPDGVAMEFQGTRFLLPARP